jgi:hypothetical protein
LLTAAFVASLAYLQWQAYHIAPPLTCVSL